MTHENKFTPLEAELLEALEEHMRMLEVIAITNAASGLDWYAINKLHEKTDTAIAKARGQA